MEEKVAIERIEVPIQVIKETLFKKLTISQSVSVIEKIIGVSIYKTECWIVEKIILRPFEVGKIVTVDKIITQSIERMVEKPGDASLSIEYYSPKLLRKYV